MGHGDETEPSFAGLRSLQASQAADPSAGAVALIMAAANPLWRVRAIVAANPSAPPSVLDTLCTDTVERVRRRIIANPSASVEHLRKLADDPRRSLRYRAWADHRLPVDELKIRTIAPTERKAFWRALWLRSLTPEGASELAHSTHLLMESAAAYSPALRPDDIVHLALRPDSIKAILATRSDLPEPTAVFLASFGGIEARQALAAKPTVEPKVLDALIKHGDASVRRQIAVRPDLSRRMVKRLARDRDWSVRALIAASSSTRTLTVCRLRNDGSLAVRCAALGNERCSIWFFEGGENPVETLAKTQNHRLNSFHAARLAEHKNPWVKGSMLGNASLPEDLLQRAIGDLERPAWELRVLASNPRVAADEADRLRAWIALGGASGDPAFDPVADVGTIPDGVVEPLRFGKRRPSALGRIRAEAMPSQIGNARLMMYATDPSFHVRWNLATYSPLPHNVLETLSNDPSPLIAQRASWQLLSAATSEGWSISPETLNSPAGLVERVIARTPMPVRIAGALVFFTLVAFGAMTDEDSGSTRFPFGIDIPVVTTLVPENPNIVRLGSCNSGVSFTSVSVQTARITNNRLTSIQVTAITGVDGLTVFPPRFKLPSVAAIDFEVDNTNTIPDLMIKADGQHSRCRGYASFVESQGLVPVSCERFDISPPTQARCYGTPE